jgi:hypothetical protein
MIKGMLKWIKQRKNSFDGGIELSEILDINTFIKLSLRFNWENKENKEKCQNLKTEPILILPLSYKSFFHF